jgi:hypothetical protein
LRKISSRIADCRLNFKSGCGGSLAGFVFAFFSFIYPGSKTSPCPWMLNETIKVYAGR